MLKYFVKSNESSLSPNYEQHTHERFRLFFIYVILSACLKRFTTKKRGKDSGSHSKKKYQNSTLTIRDWDISHSARSNGRMFVLGKAIIELLLPCGVVSHLWTNESFRCIHMTDR
jgi:hypothetical protein